MLLPELGYICMPSYRSVAPRIFLVIMPFVWPFFITVVTISGFFSPCFKLGQNLSSCQVSEKSTHRFGQDDGTNIQTDR